jgi:sucrose-6-phosphate hydrolase SacC (GH32 family)
MCNFSGEGPSIAITSDQQLDAHMTQKTKMILYNNYLAREPMNITLVSFLCSLFLTAACWAKPQDNPVDIMLEDFEQETYAPWKVTGDAFGNGPAHGSLPGQMPVAGFKGKGLVNSFFQGDNSKGSLVSPVFRIERKFISFLIGGGKSQRLALELVVDGQVVQRATGPNDKPGGSEELSQDSWDVSEWMGKQGTLRIIDDADGSWGHINVDHIVMTDTKPKGLLANVEKNLIANSRYLHIPVKNGAPKRAVSLLVDGTPIVQNDIELSDGKPDWWAPMDVGGYRGKTLTLRVDKLHEDSLALEQIEASDTLKDADAIYSEALRGQFHFSPKRGWNNDPNGCVFYNGEYHLFFQHNPYGWGWGNMHWGHAVSKDLVHWEELGDVLLPDSMGPMFSGSAVVDWKNTSGLGQAGRPPLVLIYTAAGNPTVQGIAYSTDGRNFTKYSGNPVLPEITGGNRDPKVFWHEASKQWVMVLYVEYQGRHTIHFFKSSNLKEWKLASISKGDAPGSGYLYECPDFFELPIDGNGSRSKWVLAAANSSYALGDFDGENFLPDATRLTGHRGKGFYAPQSFSDVPDGRRISIGWWQTETKGMPFNQSMTIPLELRLTQTDDGPRLTYTPVKELEKLRVQTHRFGEMALKPQDKNPLESIHSELVEVRVEFKPGDAKQIVMNIRDVMVEYDIAKQELIVAGHRAAAPLRDGKQRLIVYCDRTGVEVFASDGLCYVPMPYNTKQENKQLFLEVREGTARILSLDVHELRSAWKSTTD